jgi:CheY-like chemotaxis protein
MELINDVIDYSKLAVGKMKKRKECFSLQEVIDIVNNTMDCRLKEKRQKCHYVISRNLPKYIVSDKQKIIQILVNLISNANKFTDVRGFISVHISPKRENTIEFTVKDNGIGISPEDQANLFDAFFQVEQSMGKTGSGLGLAISKKLTTLLGGDMHVISDVGKGSSFSFTIEYEPHLEFQKKIVKQIRCMRGKYVLVVDDNSDNRIILGEYLFEWRMKPIVCASGVEALRMIEKNRYNFAVGIIDICMSGMSGIELARNIKLDHPTFPLIGLSSVLEVDSTDFERVLDKPVNKTQLLTEIQKIFNGSMKAIVLDNSDDDSEESVSITEPNKDIKILVAEDTPHNLDLLCKMLQSIQYTNIGTAINGAIAIDKIDEEYERKEPYDVIFLDLRMPIKDGFDVINHINEKRYNSPQISIITASVLESDRNKCKKLGVKYFMSKPYTIDQVRNTLVKMAHCI